MFCYGFISHKNQVFPYQIIKFFKQTLYPYSHPLQAYFDKIKKIKNEYKGWNENPNWNEVVIKKYYPGLNIFLDRNYFNHRNDEKLKGLYLVQIPRHYSTKDIFLNVFNEIIIYRVLCEQNNNEEYTNWEKANYKLLIIGGGCIHKEVVKKKFKIRNYQNFIG